MQNRRGLLVAALGFMIAFFRGKPVHGRLFRRQRRCQDFSGRPTGPRIIQPNKLICDTSGMMATAIIVKAYLNTGYGVAIPLETPMGVTVRIDGDDTFMVDGVATDKDTLLHRLDISGGETLGDGPHTVEVTFTHWTFEEELTSPAQSLDCASESHEDS